MSIPILFLTALLGLSFHLPVAVQKSEGEIKAQQAFTKIMSDKEALKVAKELLAEYPDDIACGRFVQDKTNKLLKDKVAFYKDRYEDHPGFATYYLYARATNFALPQAEVDEVVRANPEKFWSWMLYAGDAMHDDPPNLELALARARMAAQIDPSRPEGFYAMGKIYMRMSDVNKARAAFEAALFCDPEYTLGKKAVLDIYLDQRDAVSYLNVLGDTVSTGGSNDVGLASLNSTSEESTTVGQNTSILICMTCDTTAYTKTVMDDLETAFENSSSCVRYAIQVEAGKWAIADASVVNEQLDVHFLGEVKTRKSSSFDESAAPSPRIFVTGDNGFTHVITNSDPDSGYISTVAWIADQIKNGI